MKCVVQGFRALLIIGFIWLGDAAVAEAGSECTLVFEVIPSKDAGPIIGPGVNHKLATKKFKAWQEFTEPLAAKVVEFLNENFAEVATFGEPTSGTGGFEGKSNPNAFIQIVFGEDVSGNALGEPVTMMTAAVGFMLIQDGTVAYCKKPVGKYGQSWPFYKVLPDKGFKPGVDDAFV